MYINIEKKAKTNKLTPKLQNHESYNNAIVGATLMLCTKMLKQVYFLCYWTVTQMLLDSNKN